MVITLLECTQNIFYEGSSNNGTIFSKKKEKKKMRFFCFLKWQVENKTPTYFTMDFFFTICIKHSFSDLNNRTWSALYC